MYSDRRKERQKDRIYQRVRNSLWWLDWIFLYVRGSAPPGCARFPEILQNFSERQILWSLCLVVFHPLTLKLPIQTSLSVVPKLPVSLSSAENCHEFRKTSTPLAEVTEIHM